MKNMKTNTVQLAIAGIVVVLVAICGTFAWYSVSESANVKPIGATVVAPSAGSGISEVQYNVNGVWNAYDGTVPLNLIPGQTINFRVIFYAGSTQTVTMKMVNIATEEGGKTFDYTDKYQVDGALPLVCKALQHKVNLPNKDFVSWCDDQEIYFDATNGNKPSVVILEPTAVDNINKDNGRYICEYDLSLPGTAGNEYQNQSIKFDLELTIS